MSGLSFGLGSKRPSHRSAAPAKPKKPLTVNDLFNGDSSDDEAAQPNPQPRQPARQAPQQQEQPQKRTRWDAAAGAAVAPPSDPEVKKGADKLAEFVAKHGRSFEDITKQRNPGDTVFKFLFNPSCADYKYYESKVKELAAPTTAGPSALPPPPPPPQPPKYLPPPPRAHAPVPSSSSSAAVHRPAASSSRFSGQGPFHSEQQEDEPVEKHIAKNALAAGDTVAAMNAYAALVERRARGSGDDADDDRSQPLLNDTAFERRKVVAVFKDDGSRGHHMQDFIPQEEMAKFMSACGDEAAKRAAQSLQAKNALTEDNIGHKLLQKMGWREGEGIGGTQKGITAPVSATGIKQDNLGLGAAPVHEVSQEDDIFEQYRKRMMLGYKYRPNPLGNPRKPYY